MLFFHLYSRPFSGMSRILDEGRLLNALLIAAGTGILLQLAGGVRTALPLTAFFAIATLALVFVPTAILAANLLGRLGGVAVVFERDYLAVLVCAIMGWSAAFLPLALLQILLRNVRVPLPLAAGLALWLLASLYFLFLAACALRTAMGATMTQAAIACILAAIASILGLAIASFTRGMLYYLASPFFLYFAYRIFASDPRSLGSGLRGRQSLRHHLDAAALNPHDAGAQYQIGLIHQQRRQWKEAEACFRRAAEIDPEEIDALFQLARLTRRQGRLDEAASYLERVLALNDRHSLHEAWRELGALEFERNRLPEAEQALRTFVERREYDPEGLYWYGKVLHSMGRAAEAREAFQRAVDAARTMPSRRKAEVRQWGGKAASELRALRS
ncbi:MAG: tetratricopeptide repeat protein [Bryobacterales bacterium]|nr:tetratricopeptide repeat protein [Bryobacterales bacterium]